MNIESVIKDNLPSAEYLFGFADLGGLLSGKYSQYTYGVSIVRRLDSDIMDGVLAAQGPTEDYYKLYYRVNAELAEAVSSVSDALARHGIENFPVQPTAHDKDIDKTMNETLSFGFSHKMCATRSGLGWIGKTDLFVSEKFGPRVRLSSILTNHPLPIIRTPIDKSRCGTCSLCVSNCPAKAANGLLWDKNTPREAFYDPFKCRDKCRELTTRNIGTNESICGICVAVCPQGRKS
jgi:epoxyqueuosine reductase QueG